MATFHDPLTFGRHIRDGATVLQKSQRIAVNKAALVAKTALLSAPGAPKGKVAGGRVGVRYDVKGFDKPTALVKWFGPAHLVNNDTHAHRIAPKKRRGKKAIASSSFGPFASAEHPGTRGKHFYEKGRDTAYNLVPSVLRTETKIALGRHFGGI